MAHLICERVIQHTETYWCALPGWCAREYFERMSVLMGTSCRAPQVQQERKEAKMRYKTPQFPTKPVMPCIAQMEVHRTNIYHHVCEWAFRSKRSDPTWWWAAGSEPAMRNPPWLKGRKRNAMCLLISYLHTAIAASNVAKVQIHRYVYAGRGGV